ncbi:MAG: L,D-transpeptidase [Desulfobacterales bacterium]
MLPLLLVIRAEAKDVRCGHELVQPDLPKSAQRLPVTSFLWDPLAKTVVGSQQRHLLRQRETLLDVARNYRLGFNELQDLHPSIDPWIPPAGMSLPLPSQWVLPESSHHDLVINVAELRLYRFMKVNGHAVVQTFPIGIGDVDWPTPTGEYRITSKLVHPTWIVPPSLRDKYAVKSIPPGPDNPLGDYWMGLGGSHYGIHGTDIPWSVGRLVTRGCIRLYPEDIEYLFNTVDLSATVKLIYEPVKIGRLSRRIFAEVHPDVYGLIDDFTDYGLQRLHDSGWSRLVDEAGFRKALAGKKGIPTDVTAADPEMAQSDVRSTGGAAEGPAPRHRPGQVGLARGRIDGKRDPGTPRSVD